MSSTAAPKRRSSCPESFHPVLPQTTSLKASLLGITSGFWREGNRTSEPTNDHDADMVAVRPAASGRSAVRLDGLPLFAATGAIPPLGLDPLRRHVQPDHALVDLGYC